MPTIKVDGMHCGHCKKRVEEAVSGIPGVKSATVDLAKKEVEYQEDGAPVAVETVMQVIRDAGYEPHA